MTSSLVGSEMCIRDSNIAVDRQRDMGGMVFVLRTTSHSSQRDAAYRAVSYTHLTLPTICSV
eukprot:6108967-Prorocentrum_lima.AAC.1